MSGRTVCWRILGSALLIVTATQAAAIATTAETAAPADSVSMAYRLEEVVVYAEPHEALGMVTELRGDELLDRGGGDAAQLLRFDPGLMVTAGGKAETETRIRGMPARATLILVDGRPVNPGYYGKVDLSMIATSGVAAVQLVKGPASAAYGPNAMGGVINIVTRSGFAAPGTDLSVRGGGDALRQLSLSHAEKYGSHSIAVHGYEQHRDGFQLSGDFVPTSLEDGGLRTDSGYRKAGGGLKAGYERHDGDIYTLTLDYHWSRREVPPTIYTWESPTWRRFPLWMRYGASLNNQRHLGRSLELVTVLHADGQHDRLVDYRNASLADEAINWDSRLENRSYGGSVLLTGMAGMRHRFRAGATFRHDRMNKQPDVDQAWDRHTLGTGSVFAELRYVPARSLAMTGGLQSSWHRTARTQQRRLAMCPTLAMRWSFTDHMAVRTSYSRAMRYPTLHRLYSVSSGNPDLRPESAVRYEFGIEQQLVGGRGHGLRADVTWFRSNLTDLIDRPARHWQYRNVDSARIAGLEAAVRVSVSDRLQVDVGYAWIDRSVTSAEILRELPPHRLSLGLTGRTAFGTRLRYDLAALDERTTHLPERRHPACRLHGLTIRQTLSGGLTAHLELVNITDVDHQEELGYPAPGRTVTVGLDWRR